MRRYHIRKKKEETCTNGARVGKTSRSEFKFHKLVRPLHPRCNRDVSSVPGRPLVHQHHRSSLIGAFAFLFFIMYLFYLFLSKREPGKKADKKMQREDRWKEMRKKEEKRKRGKASWLVVCGHTEVPRTRGCSPLPGSRARQDRDLDLHKS